MEIRACINTIEFLANHCNKSAENMSVMDRAHKRLIEIQCMQEMVESGFDFAPVQSAVDLANTWMNQV